MVVENSGLGEGEGGNRGGLLVLNAERFEEAVGEEDEEFVKAEKRDGDEDGAQRRDRAGKRSVGSAIEMRGLPLEISVTAFASHTAEIGTNEKREENREDQDDDTARGDVAMHGGKPRRERERYSTVT